MPTYSLMKIPKTKSAEEFELICVDILSIIYNTKFKRYGRNGQKQNGIDIYSSSKKNGCIVAQCKNYLSQKSSKKFIEQIKKDVKSTENLDFFIDKFIVMTSIDEDVKIQEKILSMEHINFDIEIWFWNDIQIEFFKNKQLLNKYYPQLYNQNKIDSMELNEIITNINNLDEYATRFNANYNSNHSIGYNEINDDEIYKKCEQINITALNLSTLMEKWYTELDGLKIIKIIKNILGSVPDFYYKDTTGANSIYTISEYIDYFSSDENIKPFVNNCKKAIKKLKN